MHRIDNKFVSAHFQADYVEHIYGGWKDIQAAVLNARKVLKNSEDFPNANFEYLEELDFQGTIFLLQAPIQYIT